MKSGQNDPFPISPSSHLVSVGKCRLEKIFQRLAKTIWAQRAERRLSKKKSSIPPFLPPLSQDTWYRVLVGSSCSEKLLVENHFSSGEILSADDWGQEAKTCATVEKIISNSFQPSAVFSVRTISKCSVQRHETGLLHEIDAGGWQYLPSWFKSLGGGSSANLWSPTTPFTWWTRMQLKINRGAAHGVAHYDRDAVDDIRDLGWRRPALEPHLFTVVVVSITVHTLNLVKVTLH